MAQEPMRIYVEFYMGTIKDEQASKEQGRPIYNETEMVKIQWVGDNKKVLEAPANAYSAKERGSNDWITYAERFPAQYEAFKRNAKHVGSGTPIEEAPFLDNAQKAELKGINIHTIEALADLDQAGQRKLGMEAAGFVAKAKAYIDNASGSAAVLSLAAQNAEMKAQMEAMRAQMDQLIAKAPAPVMEAPVADDDDDVSGSVFSAWGDPELKAWIKDKTGQAPRGTPSHATLVSMAEEANASAKEAA